MDYIFTEVNPQKGGDLKKIGGVYDDSYYLESGTKKFHLIWRWCFHF
jgi:hypothetical protein